jgi:integrase
LSGKHPAIKTILRGAARGAPLPRRVRPLLAKQVRALLRDLGEDPADLRDAALLAVGVASGCRRSELSGLDWMQRGAGAGVIETTVEGATITLFCSKTSHGEEAETIHIQPGVALKALRRWIEGGGIAAGTPLFRASARAEELAPVVSATAASPASSRRGARRRASKPKILLAIPCAPAW